MIATKLTSAEFDAIETILANGGKVIAHMGRKRKGAVNKRLLLDMQDRGLVRMIGSGSDYYLRSGPARVNVEVRAAACAAFNAEQGRRALKDAPRRQNPSIFPPNAITDPMEMRFFLNQLKPDDVVTFFYRKAGAAPVKSMTVEVEGTQPLSSSFIVHLRKKGPMRPSQFGGPALEASKASDAVMYAASMTANRIPVLALSKGTATMLEDKEPTMRAARANPRRNPSDAPKIYVANLAAYNAGRLKGKWIEPSTDAEELSEQIVEAIGGNPDHEWAFHDYDGFPDMGENPSLEDVAMMAELLEEHPVAVIKAAQQFAGAGDMDELKEWLDEGYGIYESKRDYVEQYIDDMGGPSKLGKQTIDTYFDYESFGHDLSIDADEEDRERYEGMSDQEIGEEAINDFYGDEIPKDLADRYFDYDSFARDVFYEVASVRVPGEGLVVFSKR